MRDYLLYILLATGLFFSSCSVKEKCEQPTGNAPVEISFAVEDFVSVSGLRATDDGSAAEQRVNNLYLLMFDNSGANPFRYYITGATFTGGTYNSAAKKITLAKTQAEAANRKVYLIANIDTPTKSALDGITTEAALKNYYKDTAQPWGTNIVAPLCMVGYKAHNFAATPASYQLKTIPLQRAVAKVELNIKLTKQFQVAPTEVSGALKEYRFRYVNFDRCTYFVKPATKPSTLVSSTANEWPNVAQWIAWGNTLGASEVGTSYTLTSGKVSSLKIVTYLNEQDNAAAKIEIALPRVDEGPLPPPEFGPEKYILPLPKKVERNKWYKYDIEI